MKIPSCVGVLSTFINNRTFLERYIFVPSKKDVGFFRFACAVRRARSTGSIITMLRYTYNKFLWCSIFKCAIKAIVIYNLLADEYLVGRAGRAA